MSDDSEITVVIKSSVDKKYEIKVAKSATIASLKDLVAAAFDVPASAQRLIYSGRVLKDTETVDSYKIKDGNTVHLVKSAAARAATSASTSTASPSTSSTAPAASATPSNPASQIPTNIAAGQGANNPFAALTGARYAGYAQLPSESMFGPDGGMGAPPNPDEMMRMLENPMVQQGMNEMLRNPQMLDYLIQQSPELRALGPQAREILQSDSFRQMMTNPQMIRQMRQMQQLMGGGPAMGGAPAFPAPGSASATENTDSSNAASTGAGAAGATNNTDATPGAANPFAANPFAMFAPPTSSGDGAAANPFGVDPQQLQSMMQMFGGMQPGAAAAPEDNRPPEERYESQLRQLNDMGFMDFDANVRALRRSGGSVQGAVENLLNGI